MHVDVALQWCSDTYSDTLIGFVNSIKTIDGGTHMDGLKAALTRTVNALGRKVKTLKEGDPNLSGDHVREGLGAVVSVKVVVPASVAYAPQEAAGNGHVKGLMQIQCIDAGTRS